MQLLTWLRQITNMKKVLIFTFFLILASANKAYAQEISVGVDPSILQIEAKGPSLVKSPIRIENQSNQNVTYSIFLVPFKASNLANGQPEFERGLLDSYKDIFGRIKISDENGTLTQISLAPKQKKDLTLSIRLNDGEPPKDYYFSVVFISEAISESDKESFVGARAGIGTNILLSVGPKSPTKGFIEEFNADKFSTAGPKNFRLKVRNESSHYVNTSGNVLIKNMFGQTVGNINLVTANILSNSSRFIESENNENPNIPRIIWNEKLLLGVYKAELTLALSEEGPIYKDSVTFFAFPVELIGGLLLVILVTIGMIRRARSRTS